MKKDLAPKRISHNKKSSEGSQGLRPTLIHEKVVQTPIFGLSI